MNPEIIALIVSILPLTLLGVIAARHKRRYDLILNTETSKITTLKKGFYEIKGRVEFLKDKLVSPYSRSECVYYRFRVEEQRSSGKSTHWHAIIDDRKYVRFGVKDSSGIAIIEIEGGTLKFNKDEKGATGLFRKASEELKEALMLYNKTSQGWLFEKNLRFSETYIAPGDELYILGEVQDFESYYPVFRKGNLPFLISDKKEEDLLKESRRITILAFLGLVIISVGVIAFLLYQSFVL